MTLRTLLTASVLAASIGAAQAQMPPAAPAPGAPMAPMPMGPAGGKEMGGGMDKMMAPAAPAAVGAPAPVPMGAADGKEMGGGMDKMMAPAAPGAPAAPMPMGMPMGPAGGQEMGGGMDKMMPMKPMMHMMHMMRTMMAPEHVEGRIAFLRTELKITDAQLPPWNGFAEVLRHNAKAMAEARGMTMPPAAATSAPDRADQEVKQLTARLEAIKAKSAATRSLYEVLTDAQKKTADELLMPAMGGPM